MFIRGWVSDKARTASGPVFAVLAIILAAAVTGLSQKRAEVVVLSTLHQFHSSVKGYSFDDLTNAIERIRPDILAVELTPDALKQRTEQKTKQEYPKSVFSLIDKHRYQTVALEPPEPLYSELVGSLRRSNVEIQEKFPAKAEAFSKYTDSLYAYLFKRWDSIAAVNSRETDGQFEVKHAYQNALFGETETSVWEAWNGFFLDQILKTAARNRGKRILVLVGVEHAYWLRDRLRAEKSVVYRDPSVFLTKSR
jgi:hypothetical protein